MARQMLRQVVKMTKDKDWQEEADPASWGWGEEESHPQPEQVKSSPVEAGPDWLKSACVAISPLGDMLAVASGHHVVLLSGQWDSDADQWRFAVSAWLEVQQADVTCLLCLPLASHRRSSSGAADWTCLVVGDDAGHLAFYTEDGSLLFRQRLHESAVLSVSCCSRQVSAAAEEELTAVLEDVVVVLDGFALYQTLRACRNQLARGEWRATNARDAPA
ncbi:rab3 GTPase-activating protein non-catalytic subunit-like [Pollicipes pollicipes]|uniref:rab3 GTPase-activating protein non-catalytic subunit-like n=1 Tax=Pollicipes pollicipes TaxID=41117 RepID=UPI0018852670|nr:rab3 GTPase-activating protein non-catalytic subunit-like [Pollicipes pollicipes]